METHRYFRQNLVRNPVDQYDINAYNRSSSQEYWTNRKTTLLGLPTIGHPSSNSQSSSFRQETTTKYYCRHTSPPPVKFTERQSPPKMSSSSSSSSSSSLIRNSLISGSIAGMTSTIACHPFDVLRVKMQSTALATTSNEGVVGTFRTTLQYGGFRALYTGLALPLAAQAVYKGTVFTVNNVTQSAIEEWKTQENYKLGIFTPYKVTMADRFACGFMGGAVNGAIFVTPVEYVRNQQISQHGSSSSSSSIGSRGPISVIRDTLRSDGLLGLWRGTLSTVLRDSVGCGFFFVSMAYVQQQLTPSYYDDPTPSRSVALVSGAAAGVAFWLWALPVDTMKTWIQGGTANNLTHAFELSQKDGLANSFHTLFRGWQVAYGRGAPSAAITVLSYSYAYQCLTNGS